MAEVAALAFAKSAAIFAGKAVSKALVTYVVNKALDRLPREDRDLQQRLQTKLNNTMVILRASTQQEIQDNPGLAQWLWQFRDVIQESEDALDELEFFNSQKVSPPSSKPNVGRGFLQSVSAANTSCCTSNLKIALKNLESVFDSAGNLQMAMSNRLHACSSDNQGHAYDLTNRNETSRVLTTAVFGRQNEKDAILEWLGVRTPLIRDSKLSVCAIVGGGGMGKTTLAQFVCQEKMVQDHFGDMIIWVHVSKRFEPKVLVRRILESINQKKATADALDTLQSDLTKELVTRRFLLVLDDAWEDAANERWEIFLAPLRNNAPMGGRILLTTRMRSVADAVEHQMPSDGYKCLVLGGLYHKDVMKLFKHHVSRELSPNEHMELQVLGEKIVQNLGGCPFVARVIGQWLKENTDHRKWRDFLNQNICQLDDIAPRVMEMLRLSYEDLTYEVQLCFRYCSIFPPHYKFRMEEVIEMWVCSGLILQRENEKKSKEDIGMELFNTLSRKSFFSLIPRELHADPSEDYYVMHDLIYELACFVSSEECSRFKVSDCNTAHVSDRVRHLYIEGVNSEAIDIISRSKYLRTLIIKNEECPPKAGLADNLKKAIKGRTSLRLFRFDGNGWFDINYDIAKLKHLRYISMSATSKHDLNKLFKLNHLEVLKLLKIEGEEEVRVSDLYNLPNLQKLHLPKLALSRVPHIGRLTTLRELNGFSVKKEEGHKITELKELLNLRKVFVLDVQNVCNCSEASSAELSKKNYMKLLSLEWSTSLDSIDERILDTLIPCRYISHLSISGYKGRGPPRWIRTNYLSNLVHLKIVGCVEWVELPFLGNLFRLNHLLLEYLPKLERIVGPDGDGLPPFLVTLVVKECPALSDLPYLPFSLKHLGISKVKVSCLPISDHNALRKGSTVEPQLCSLLVEYCPILFSLNSCFIQEHHYNALTSLKLICCSMLNVLPDEEHFKRISTLESVEILQCTSLLSVGGLGALSSLKQLKIQQCTGLTASSSMAAPAANSSPVLDTLEIDDLLLLRQHPFINFCLTRRLVISDGSKITMLPEEWLLQNSSQLEHIEIRNAELFESLPSRMDNFDSLRSLVLYNCPLLRSLPVMPPNLWALHMTGCCTQFKEDCEINGSEWEKIMSIHNFYIEEHDRQESNSSQSKKRRRSMRTNS